MVCFRLGLILIDKSRGIHVVDHQVEVTIIIQVTIGRAIRHAGQLEAPVFVGIIKSNIAIVAVGVIGLGFDGHVLYNRIDRFLTAGQCHFLNDLIGKEIHKIEIREIVVYSVCNENIPQAIIVHIKQQPCPAPIRGIHSAIISHFGKGAIPIIELEGVLDKLLVKILALF